MKITLKQDFTEEQENLAKDLRNQLREASQELEEFSVVEVYALKEDEKGASILFEIGYSDPEGKGNTIFNAY